MVKQDKFNDIVTTADRDIQTQPSMKRWLKHFFFLPATSRYFDQQDQNAIAQAVAEAELGHVGEIQVVIEGNMPLKEAYHLNSCQRARQLFAHYGVWDTELNSGVLIYLNLCEHAVEIVCDRGICRATTQEQWDTICQEMISLLKSQNYRQAVIIGVQRVGELLNLFYDNQVIDLHNELSNAPIIL